MEGIIYIENFINNHQSLFKILKRTIDWDERMIARKTASFGKPYNYSQLEYPYQPFTLEIETIVNSINNMFYFRPNNCLINYYETGHAKMGFHSDQTDILIEDTGIVIISIGETRLLRFRNIENKSKIVDFSLISGSLLYMKNDVQNIWQHSIIKSDTEHGRMSLTFRKLK